MTKSEARAISDLCQDALRVLNGRTPAAEAFLSKLPTLRRADRVRECYAACLIPAGDAVARILAMAQAEIND